MINLQLHHIGLATRSLEMDKDSLLLLGFEQESNLFFDPIQKINCLFMKQNHVRIEIIEPTSTDSPVTEIIARGHKMYHQCFECTDIYKTIDYLCSKGAHLLSPPVPAIAFEGRNICFLILRSMLIVELIEKSNEVL
ncbi:VOC family protein [Paenibacillus camerounensis]|uniref:VOC family protein n=1 Tax=Paenibacillus camerounensis TaxID=1243663 RepID=UPI0005A7A832|nr:VOC family protein [Paenibacillus camerounensis]